MAGIGSFLFVTIDSQDVDRSAAFWAALLGTEVDMTMDEGRFVFLKGSDTLPVVCFQRVPEAKTGKNRLHLDLSVEDLDDATQRIVVLGGSRVDGADRRLETFVWRTMADPEGNEFDITVG
jgi:predicted enzyme related to lactoylglutathione lyase